MEGKDKIKSVGATLAMGTLVFLAMYFIPIEKNKVETKPEVKVKETNSDSLLAIQDTLQQGQIDIPEVLTTVQTEPQAKEKEEVINKKEEVKPEDKKLTKEEPTTPKTDPKTKEAEKKLAEEKLKKEEATSKESKIGVDRKLIAGIPGTMNYKGKFPVHNVKSKGSITIAYTVDKNGNVISAQRIDGLRDRDAINNAVTLVRKYVKAEKGKANSSGTYTIKF